MLRICSVMLAVALVVTGCSAGSGTAPAGLRHQDLTIDLGGFTTRAQLTYPAEGNGPWPTVILFHGSGPWDMDATTPVSSNFKLLAERLGTESIAVLRFNKRGVNRYGNYDQAQVLKATTNQLIADSGAVIAAARARPEVDSHRLYLYGWSQGAQVAAHAAAADPDLAGLILQGPPNSGWSSILTYQHLTLGLPYLKATADANHDGSLSLKELVSVQRGAPALMGSFYVWAPDSTLNNPKLRADTDRNGDGLIDIENELRPAVERLVADPAGSGSPFLSPANEPARPIAAVVAGLGRPVLVLQGSKDGFIPVSDGEAVAQAAPDRVTFRRYPDLGHALSVTENPAEDVFKVMDPRPIADIAEWIKAH
jgi:fermentation-respiration switch protein FrsA (DUF1100 family)